MLVTRRVLATIIDGLVFLLLVLLVYPIFDYFEIDLDHEYFLLVIFCSAFFLPILRLHATIGQKIFHIKPDSSHKALVKYFIYFILISGVFGGYLGLLANLFHLHAFVLSYIPFALACMVTTALCTIGAFLLSRGKYDLFDFILKLSYSDGQYRRHPIVVLCTWLFFNYSIVITLLLLQSVYFKNILDFLTNPNNSYSNTTYFPRDVFDNFSEGELIKRESNNEILTFSDERSFYQDVFLSQKTIYSLITKSTFESPNKRLRHCGALLTYSMEDDIFSDTFDETDQTRFVLIYNEPHTFFSRKTFIYEYFYDNRNPKHYIYGGVDLDSLITYYRNRPEEYYAARLRAIAKALDVPLDSLLKRRNKEDASITLTKEEAKRVDQSQVDLPVSNKIYFTIYGFAAVKPTVIYSINFPRKSNQFLEFNDFHVNDKLYEAIAYRDFNYYNNY